MADEKDAKYLSPTAIALLGIPVFVLSGGAAGALIGAIKGYDTFYEIE